MISFHKLFTKCSITCPLLHYFTTGTCNIDAKFYPPMLNSWMLVYRYISFFFFQYILLLEFVYTGLNLFIFQFTSFIYLLWTAVYANPILWSTPGELTLCVTFIFLQSLRFTWKCSQPQQRTLVFVFICWFITFNILQFQTYCMVDYI